MPAPDVFDSPLSPDWNTLFAGISDRYARAHLRRLFAFCSARGLGPADLDESVLAAFGAAVKAAGITRPNQVVRDAAKTWNALLAGAPDGPGRPLPVPSSKKHPSIPASALQASFVEDVEAYLSRESGDALFEAREGRDLGPVTRRDRRGKILQLVTLFTEAGGDAAGLERLADLARPETIRTILSHLWVAGGRTRSGHAYNRARLLLAIARHWARVPEADLAPFREAEGNFRPKKEGMTARNREKLRPFTDEATLRRLVRLPAKIVDGLAGRTPTFTDAVRVQSALAVALLLAAPMRVGNLARLERDRHIVATPEGALAVVIPAEEVKNEVPLEYPLGTAAARLLDVYFDRYRPLLTREGSALFVSRNGRTKLPDQLSTQIQKFVKEEAGIDLNVHLFRHLAAFVFLRTHPGEYETVRQLLGHKDLATTVAFYSGFERAEAFRRYDAILERHRTNEP